MSDRLFDIPEPIAAAPATRHKKKPAEYEQLDGRALALLRAEVAKSNIKETAARLGYVRSAVSMALAGKYPGGVAKLRAKIFETFADRIDCPHLGRDIAPSECRDYREAAMPTAPRSAVAHWRACRSCLFNPTNIPAQADAAPTTEPCNG